MEGGHSSSLALLNPSLAPPSPSLRRASPSSAAQTLGAFTTTEALLELSGAWPGQQGTSQGSGSHPDSPPVAGAVCFLQQRLRRTDLKGASERGQVRHVPGDARAGRRALG